MAKRTVVATLAKRVAGKPMAYVDKKGNVVHFAPKGRKKRVAKSILEKNVVGKDLLKQRKALKIVLFIKGKKVYKAKNGLRRRGGRRRGR